MGTFQTPFWKTTKGKFGHLKNPYAAGTSTDSPYRTKNDLDWLYKCINVECGPNELRSVGVNDHRIITAINDILMLVENYDFKKIQNIC